MFVIELIVVNILIIVIISIYCKLTCGICKCSRHLVGKVVIVTGGNAGIGFETAKDLAERGAKVILACRSEARGAEARDKIISLTDNKDVHFRQMDLASFKSVRNFADNIIKTEKRLDILINNAGVFKSENVKTEDGLLVGMQINHFGPFLLTCLLLPLLKSSAPSRIINVSTMVYKYGDIDFEDLNMEKGFAEKKLYMNSKFCNVVFTVELDRLLKGTGVTVNCLHPGAVMTNIMGPPSSGVLSEISRRFMRIVLIKSAWEGAQTSIYLAVSPEVKELSGRYFRDCFEQAIVTKALDPEIGRKLWKVSEKVVGVDKAL